MSRVVYDPSVSSIVVDLLLEAADGDVSSHPCRPRHRGELDDCSYRYNGAARIRSGQPGAGPPTHRSGSGIEFAPRATVRSATAIGQKVTNLDVLCHDLPPESGVDGLLGLNFLRHFRLTIRFRKGIIDLNKER